MKLRYETSIATFIQFVTIGLLNIATGLNSIITTCRHTPNDCVSNAIVSPIFFILLTLWFACVWILGYFVQEKRSKFLAFCLIGAEGLIALIALFNAKHHTDALSLVTSLLDLGFAIWVTVLALRIFFSKGGRVVARQGPRRRRRHPPTEL